jgi:hypothetical protein
MHNKASCHIQNCKKISCRSRYLNSNRLNISTAGVRVSKFCNRLSAYTVNKSLLCPRIERSGAYCFWPVHLFVCLTVCLSAKNFKHWPYLLISYVCSLWQDLSIGTKVFDLVTLKFDPLFKNFNIDHIIWMVSDRAFIFHMCVPYDKTFLLVPKFLTLWPWPWSLTHFS